MTRITLAICLAIVAAGFFVGCSKSSDNPSSSPSAILTSGKWHTDSAISVINFGSLGTVTEDLMLDIPACQADNLGTFNSDGTTSLDEGATKCDASDPQVTTSGNWKLLNNNTKLQMNDPVSGVTITMDIVSLDDKLLKLTYTSGGVGASAFTTYYLGHVK